MAVTTPARERTRHEIVRQAMDLFQARGYNATSLQDIATAAGCSKATVLYHFHGKPAVLAAVLEPAAADLATLIRTVDGVPRAVAQEIAIQQFTDLAVKHRGVVQVVQDILPVIDEIPEISGLITDGMQLSGYLAGTDDQLERDLATLAINGVMGECRHPGERTDEELRILCDTALRRLLKNARPRTA